MRWLSITSIDVSHRKRWCFADQDVVFRRARDGVSQGEWGLMVVLLAVLYCLTIRGVEFNGCSHISATRFLEFKK